MKAEDAGSGQIRAAQPPSRHVYAARLAKIAVSEVRKLWRKRRTLACAGIQDGVHVEVAVYGVEWTSHEAETSVPYLCAAKQAPKQKEVTGADVTRDQVAHRGTGLPEQRAPAWPSWVARGHQVGIEMGAVLLVVALVAELVQEIEQRTGLPGEVRVAHRAVTGVGNRKREHRSIREDRTWSAT